MNRIIAIFFGYPCRGVLHTPHKWSCKWPNERENGRGFGSFLPDESKIGSGLDSSGHWRGRLWGVCNTPLPCRTKIHRGFSSFLSDESKIGSELDSFGLWRGRLWGVCCCALHGHPKKWQFSHSFGLWRGRLWGVFNTPLPYRTKIHRGFGSFLSDESKIRSGLDSFGHRRGRLWGVCCCALHGQTKTGLVFGLFLAGEGENGRG